MITINEIAKMANVSVGTVDRVIHKRGRVSKVTEQRVLKIVKDLNYKPNILARSLSRLKSVYLGVLMPKISHDNQYWEHTIQGIETAYEELKIHKVMIDYFKYEGYSEMSFKRVSQKALEANLDGLLIVPTIYKTFDDDFVKTIPESLPYAFFNSNIPNCRSLSYIGQDSFQSGTVAGDLMQKVIQNEATIAVLTIHQDDYHINERLKGFLSAFENNSSLKIHVYGAERSEDKKTFDNLLKQMFTDNKNLRGVFVTTALTYRVAEFIAENSIKNKVFVVGYDLTDKNIHYLKNGLIDFLIGQRPEAQGYQGIYTLYKHVVLNEKVEQRILMPIDIIIKSNLDFYLNQISQYKFFENNI